MCIFVFSASELILSSCKLCLPRSIHLGPEISANMSLQNNCSSIRVGGEHLRTAFLNCSRFLNRFANTLWCNPCNRTLSGMIILLEVKSPLQSFTASNSFYFRIAMYLAESILLLTLTCFSAPAATKESPQHVASIVFYPRDVVYRVFPPNWYIISSDHSTFFPIFAIYPVWLVENWE